MKNLGDYQLYMLFQTMSHAADDGQWDNTTLGKLLQSQEDEVIELIKAEIKRRGYTQETFNRACSLVYRRKADGGNYIQH